MDIHGIYGDIGDYDVKKGTVLLAMREKLNDNYKLEFKLGKLKHKF